MMADSRTAEVLFGRVYSPEPLAHNSFRQSMLSAWQEAKTKIVIV